MMKLTLCAALVWMIFSSAEALQCQHKEAIGDTTSKPCNSSAELCATIVFQVSEGSRTYDSIVRMCVPPSFCAAQDQIFSFSHAGYIVAGSFRCCNTDDCNSGNLTYPDLKPNGLNCSTCTDQTVCNNTVECYGNQDHCFKRTAEALRCLHYEQIGDTISKPCNSSAELCATVVVNALYEAHRFNHTKRICVPPSVCAAQDQILSVSKENYNVAASIRCCNTDNCNSDTLTYPDLKPNSLNCSTCADQTACNTAMECASTQDHCFNGTVTRSGRMFQIHGCASANLCEDHSDWEGYFFFDHFHLGTGASNCWKAALRDSALTTRLSLFLFLLALFTLFIS